MINRTTMYNRINKKLDTYISSFKNDIQEKATELGLNENPEVSNLLMYIYEYNRLTFSKEDFMKRKRNKIGVNSNERCMAKRSNGEQCTRRKKQGHDFCGTHAKGIPHGICEVSDISQEPTTNKIEVSVKDINGIMYFIDAENNVYSTEDVLMKKRNPKIIGKCILNENTDDLEIIYGNE